MILLIPRITAPMMNPTAITNGKKTTAKNSRQNMIVVSGGAQQDLIGSTEIPNTANASTQYRA